MSLHQSELLYIGHQISAQGVKPDMAKVTAVGEKHAHTKVCPRSAPVPRNGKLFQGLYQTCHKWQSR